MICLPPDIPKEDIYNKRIHLEDFPIFSNPNSLKVAIGFLENFHADDILSSFRTTSKKKMKIAKYYERMAKKFKAARENLDTSAEEPRASGTTSAGTTFGKYVRYEARLITVDNSSSIPSTTLT